MAMGKDGASGILARMARIALPGSGPRSTLAGASGAASGDGDADSEYEGGKGRHLLRELMERRRRNDMVRQREFDQLRRMRRLAAASAPPPTDSDTGVDSETGEALGFLDTAIDINLEERAVTLRKIDEIEEQMSSQWWKTRPVDAVAPPPGVAGAHPVAEGDSRRLRRPSPSRPRPAPPVAGTAYRNKMPPPLPTNFAQTALYGDSGGLASSSAVARPGDPPPPALQGAAPVALQPDPDHPASLDLELPDLEITEAPGPDPALPDAALAQLVFTGPGPLPGPQPALPGFVHDPVLEEVAIAFANGDVDTAEAGLHSLVDAAAARADGEPSQHELWFTLFDFHRALGRRESFETAAITYAERFGRSPPAWISLAADAAPHAEAGSDFYWRCPPLVAAATVQRLRAEAESAVGTWWLDWAGLEGFEYDALAPLLETFGAWSLLPVQINFEGGDRLLAALEARTLTGAADAEADWWRLRMETLRLLRRMDDYEEAALDYCITYEVSPPSWQAPVCDCRALQIGSRQAVAGDPLAVLGIAATGAGPALPSADGPTLAGEIGCDVGTVLAQLDAVVAQQARSGLPGREELLVIDCTRLVRLDFVAAGSVLGWAASRHGEGFAVEFRNLHRLAGTFFNVTGISEYARVYVRPA